ncbi:hypothetical protein NB311A_16304 [Nitrobacter sp. Nb-311A]|nr:hypothetical protein NB311A_16304 [Nitrobacter sp. Nb-311A]
MLVRKSENIGPICGIAASMFNRSEPAILSDE